MSVPAVIQKNMPIKEVEQLFSAVFPFLKIEISEKPNGKNIASNKNINNKPLADYLLPQSNFNQLAVQPNMSVKELINTIVQNFNLQAKVLRKFGNIWLETSITANWSLEQQNKEGQNITHQLNIKK